MRPQRVLLAVLLLLVLAAVWSRVSPYRPSAAVAEDTSSPVSAGAPAGESGPAVKAATQDPGSPMKVAAATPPIPSATVPDDGRTTQRVFRLILENGTATLDAVEDVRGDFHRKRAMAAEAGMLCCRLLDAKDEVLAETFMRAPDYVCIVLDPNASADGTPAPARLTSKEPILFQVHMPPLDGAASLKLYRLEKAGAAPWNVDPPGRLLSTIQLANR